MPIIESTYKPPYFFRKGFVATVYSGLIRNVSLVQQRERITLSDGDFLDLDWSYAQEKSSKVIIILHGMEGSAQRAYVTGTAKLCNENNIDALSVNFRGCSGEDNLLFQSYHSGATNDLNDVIAHVIETKSYSEIYIKGISLGGNVALKYLGETTDIPNEVKGGIAVSVPCHLAGSAKELHKLKNFAFHEKFKRDLINKLRVKSENHPHKISYKDLKTIKSLYDFDNYYTAKAHGFINGEDYYEKSSSLQFLPNIEIPTLIINALNDSFLSAECYPVKEAINNSKLYLEMPKYGGHMGFIQKGGYYYNELRTLEFIRENS